MTRRITILGATKEASRVRTFMRAIESTPGLVLAIDWMEGRDESSCDSMRTDAEAFLIAQRVLQAGLSSDLVWWLVPSCPSQSFGEWLVLRTHGVDTITSGREEDRKRLLYRPDMASHFEADEDALAFVRGVFR